MRKRTEYRQWDFDSTSHRQSDAEENEKRMAVLVSVIFAVIVIWGLYTIATLPNCYFGGPKC